MSRRPELRFVLLNCAKAAKRRSNKERKAIKKMILLAVAFLKKNVSDGNKVHFSKVNKPYLGT